MSSLTLMIMVLISWAMSIHNILLLFIFLWPNNLVYNLLFESKIFFYNLDAPWVDEKPRKHILKILFPGYLKIIKNNWINYYVAMEIHQLVILCLIGISIHAPMWRPVEEIQWSQWYCPCYHVPLLRLLNALKTCLLP